LGGDIAFDLNQRQATDTERSLMKKEGKVSRVIRMRAMVSRADGQEATLAELKAVDAAYPLYGHLALGSDALGPRPAADDAALARGLADRLGVRPGDHVRIGGKTFRMVGVIDKEPEGVGSGLAFGPTAIINAQGLAGTVLLQPGSIYTAQYRVRIPPDADPKAAIKRVKAASSGSDWDIRDRTNGAPGARRFLERLGQFLSLVGLTSLVVAGIGVGNGVAGYLDGKRASIATLKALGAPSRTIMLVYLFQIGLVAIGGILAGLVVGALLPALIYAVVGDALPVPPSLAVYPAPLLISAAYGFLTAAIFAVAPLARAGRVPAASLFRGGLAPSGRTGWRVTAIIVLLGCAIAGLAVAFAREPGLAAWFIVATLALLALLTLLGWGIQRGAAALPRPSTPLARLTLANLHRPGAQTGRLVVALGLGLSLFATLGVIETNLSGQMASSIPARSPSFFAIDIPSDSLAQFRAIVERDAKGADVVSVPSLRGPVVAVRGQRVSDMKNIPEDAWILDGDRGLTYAQTLPKGSRVVHGEWWPTDYAGPPLVSVDIRAAKALGLKVGDSLTVSVLGVEILARIASFREIDWDSMGLNFGMIFSPKALEGAPHSYLATITLPGGAGSVQERAINRDIASVFPSASLIRVKDVITTLSDLLGQLSLAVRAAASVTVAAGIAVLVGAIAAARRSRLYDSVLLKLLGATRRQILMVQAMEYGLLALIISGLALLVSLAAGWYVVTQVLRLVWAPDWPVVLLTLGAGAGLTIALGLVGSLPVLRARPATVLRQV
jgi:putative ABC transport system permease protein